MTEPTSTSTPAPLPQGDIRKRRLPSIFYGLTVMILGIVLLVSRPTPDPDLWGRFSIAALYFQNDGWFAYRDVFSFTSANAPWYDHEWLTGFVTYLVMLWTGEIGLLIFKYGMMAGVFAFLFLLHRRTYKVSALYAFYGLLVLSSIFLLGYYATVRSQVFTFIFFAFTLWRLESVRYGLIRRRQLLWLLPVSVIWGNAHGGFIVGVVLAGIYGVGELFATRDFKKAQPFFSIAAGMFIALAIINPYGFDYIKFLVHAWTLKRDFISEWHSIPWKKPLQFWELKLVIFATLAMIACRWKDWGKANFPWREFVTPTLVLLWMVVFTFRGIRFQTFLAFSLVAYLPLFMPAILELKPVRFARQKLAGQVSLFTLTLPVLIFFFSTANLIYLARYYPIFRVPIADEITQGQGLTFYPLGAIRFLRESPYEGNLLNRFGLGEMLYWTLFPRFRVSMDGRYEEVYPQEQFLDNFKFFDRRNYVKKSWLAQHPDNIGADFILLETGTPAIKVLLNLQENGAPKWLEIYADDRFQLLGRASALKKFPPYNPRRTLLTTEVKTLQDYFTPEDLKRFIVPPSARPQR